MPNFLIDIYRNLFSSSVNRSVRTAKTAIDRKTRGRGRAKLIAAQAQMEKKAMGVQHKALRTLDGAHIPPKVVPIESPGDRRGGRRRRVSLGSSRQPSLRSRAPARQNISHSGACTSPQIRRKIIGWLLIMNGDQQGRDFRLYEGENILGISADCDLIVHDAYLSAHHCAIYSDHSGLRIVDLNSQNGTYVSHIRVTQAQLLDNSLIRIGKTEMKLRTV